VSRLKIDALFNRLSETIHHWHHCADTLPTTTYRRQGLHLCGLHQHPRQHNAAATSSTSMDTRPLTIYCKMRQDTTKASTTSDVEKLHWHTNITIVTPSTRHRFWQNHYVLVGLPPVLAKLVVSSVVSSDIHKTPVIVTFKVQNLATDNISQGAKCRPQSYHVYSTRCKMSSIAAPSHTSHNFLRLRRLSVISY
jgi:hypothetical protein